MSRIDSFKFKLRQIFPGCQIEEDPPASPGGAHWIDIQCGGRPFVVEWRPHLGFGLSSPSEEYGSGADEIFDGENELVERIEELVRTGQRTAPPDSLPLSRLRQIRRMTQEELAQSLGVRQASLSKMERQEDMNLSTLQKIVEALGGRLELIARFPEHSIPLDLGGKKAS